MPRKLVKPRKLVNPKKLNHGHTIFNLAKIAENSSVSLQELKNIVNHEKIKSRKNSKLALSIVQENKNCEIVNLLLSHEKVTSENLFYFLDIIEKNYLSLRVLKLDRRIQEILKLIEKNTN